MSFVGYPKNVGKLLNPKKMSFFWLPKKCSNQIFQMHPDIVHTNGKSSATVCLKPPTFLCCPRVQHCAPRKFIAVEFYRLNL